MQSLEIDLFADQVGESLALGLSLLSDSGILATHTTVVTTMMVEAQPSDNDRQPRREFAATIGGVRSQPFASVVLQLFEHMGIAIHDRVVV